MNECQAQCATRSAATQSVAQHAHATHARRTHTTVHTRHTVSTVSTPLTCVHSRAFFVSSVLSSLFDRVLECIPSCLACPLFDPSVHGLRTRCSRRTSRTRWPWLGRLGHSAWLSWLVASTSPECQWRSGRTFWKRARPRRCWVQVLPLLQLWFLSLSPFLPLLLLLLPPPPPAASPSPQRLRSREACAFQEGGQITRGQEEG